LPYEHHHELKEKEQVYLWIALRTEKERKRPPRNSKGASDLCGVELLCPCRGGLGGFGDVGKWQFVRGVAAGGVQEVHAVESAES
jgi:hypothetical protein